MSEIPLKPITRQDIHKLETALLLGTLFRKDVIERIKKAEDRLTWLDSLAVAAGALAREKAGVPVSQIADELGRTETTIRNHLAGKTEAGKLVRETLDMIRRGELDVSAAIMALTSPEEISKLKKEIEELKKAKADFEEKVKRLKIELSKLKGRIEELIKGL
ncbi:MAG TPA: transcriptional regulator [Acidilobales archaeon]|nr:transcriptional regulator [Acidilobales archaeon]